MAKRNDIVQEESNSLKHVIFRQINRKSFFSQGDKLGKRSILIRTSRSGIFQPEVFVPVANSVGIVTPHVLRERPGRTDAGVVGFVINVDR